VHFFASFADAWAVLATSVAPLTMRSMVTFRCGHVSLSLSLAGCLQIGMSSFGMGAGSCTIFIICQYSACLALGSSSTFCGAGSAIGWTNDAQGQSDPD
jgi:hypothetical protein